MTDAAHFISHEALRDGRAIVIRAARPDDRQRIADAFASLDRESVYTRFFSYKSELTERELGALDTLDFERDVMLVVTTTAAEGEAVVASARCIAHDAADGTRAAEVAFTVTEPFQGNGIAGRLFDHLRRIAQAAGVARFEADVLPGNRAMLAVFRRTGLPLTERRAEGVVHLTLELGPRRVR
jgi:GNAT superfamily N-acetyltransferase